MLISPQALLTPDWKNEVFPINLTKEKIKNSPFVDTEQPVSRQHEIEMYEYYPWTSYWGGGLWGGGMGTSGMMTEVHEPLAEAVKKENSADTKDVSSDPHLRSTHKVTGYSIHAVDGKIGDVEDFIIEDTSWKIAFMVIDTGHWFPGKKVIISPKLIKNIEWDTSEVMVNVTEETVKNSPEYEPGEAISESYEANLQNYYGDIVADI
ncbi:MAG: PRC-barrel domain containing protein [Bacteroidota bacterium]|nr:PRC-barrel domain containing protein [Bacteroidota bacterium]